MYFKKIYLDQGAPSIYSCWKNTYGYAVRHYNVELSDFPSYVTFIRRLRSEMPEQAIYLARYGKTAFNKKYGNYLQRDYSTVAANPKKAAIIRSCRSHTPGTPKKHLPSGIFPKRR